MTQTNTDKAVSTERLALAEEIIKRWAQWIVHVSADMDEPEWPTASAYSVANDRDFVLSVLSASRTQEPAEWPTDEQIWAAHDKLWEKRTAGQFAAVRDALLAASITPPAPERSKEEVVAKALEIAKRWAIWIDDASAGEEDEGGYLRATFEADKATLLAALEPASLHKVEGHWSDDKTYEEAPVPVPVTKND